MNDNNNQIVTILNENGPLLSNELINKLSITYDISHATARTRIKRASDANVISVSPVAFRNNSRLYFLKKQSIKNKVTEIMTAIDSPESRVFNALAIEKGFLFWNEFCKITACSLNEMPYQKSAERVAQNLEALNIINIVNSDNLNDKYIKFSPEYKQSHFSSADLESRKRNLNLNISLLEELISWLERISMVGWNTGRVSDCGNLLDFNNYPFDAVGFSYILGLYRTDKKDSLYNPSMEKAGSPVLVDCIVHRATEVFDIAAFIKRIENVNGPINHNKNPYFKILPIFFVTFIKSDARDLAKQKGIIIIPIKEVFDNNILEVLEKILKLPTEDITLDPLEEILAIMKIVSPEENGDAEQEKNVFDGKFNNLKGIVFNFVVAYIFSELGYVQQKIGTIYKGYLENSTVEESCECDLTSGTRRADINIICEVKGYSSNRLVMLGENIEEKDSVKRFFERTHKIIQSTTHENRLFYIPVFITSSEFEQSAVEYMERRYGKKIQNKIELLGSTFPEKLFYGKKDLIALSNKLESGKEIRRILKEYF
jgi:DNA-binding Lrp family transcriptional regulator